MSADALETTETKVHVAVCTRNRAGILAGCLASLDNQAFDGDDVEILVVDNGSTDGTADLLGRWADAGPLRRSVREPGEGLSRARNRALHESDRDVVIFLDDDALVTPGWAMAHAAAHVTATEQAMGMGVGAVGGPVGLVWPAGRPDWVTDAITMWYSALDLGDHAGPYPDEHGPYGTNMSVCRRAALAVGGFDPRLGRRGRSLLSSEERDLNRRLVAAGWDLHYEPAAAVVQQVLPERLRRSWLLRRGWAQGISNARFALGQAPPSRRSRLEEAWAEIHEAVDVFRERGVGEAGELAGVIVALAHAGAASELARSALAGDS